MVGLISKSDNKSRTSPKSNNTNGKTPTNKYPDSTNGIRLELQRHVRQKPQERKILGSDRSDHSDQNGSVHTKSGSNGAHLRNGHKFFISGQNGVHHKKLNGYSLDGRECVHIRNSSAHSREGLTSLAEISDDEGDHDGFSDFAIRPRKVSVGDAVIRELDCVQGLNLKFYRPVTPRTLDRLMFMKGTQGRQASHRSTAPDILLSAGTGSASVAGNAEDGSSRQSPRLPLDGTQPRSDATRKSLWGSAVGSLRQSPTGSDQQGGQDLSFAQKRRGSTSGWGISATSVLENGRSGNKALTNVRNTRKFIYSLTRMMGKSAESKESGADASQSSWSRRGLSLGRSLGLRVMMRREQMLGGQRMAALGTYLAARKRYSLTDQVVISFDAKIPWRKLALWVRIRGVLGVLHRKVVDNVVHDPSSPFYMQLNKTEDCIDRGHNMFFDPSDFKANRQMRTSMEVRRVLTLKPHERTAEDIHCAMIGLRGISTIAEYPIRMQRYFAEFATFECYPAKRAIVRQGRPPEAFYYIMYGRVLVAVKDDVTGQVDIKCYLHRGHSFGEIAIIKNSKRQSSVITKNYTELLCLSSEVFQKFFMVGGVKNINDPDQNNFVKSLSFLRGWPLQLILDGTDHSNVTFGYFKRGSVLAKNSNYSDWLFIVKSGSLTVLKKLRKSGPTVSRKTGQPRVVADSNDFIRFLSNGREYIRYLEQNNIVTPLPIGHEDEDLEEEELDCADSVTEDGSGYDVTGDAVSRVCLVNRPHTTSEGGKRFHMGKRAITFYSARGKSSSTSGFVEFKADSLLLKKKTKDTKQPRERYTIQRDRSVSRDLGPDEVLELEDKRTFLDDLDSAFNSRANIHTEADANPQFVYVQTLTKGDVFGLAQCLFHDQPSLNVVSNGADCLILNKKFFLDHCSSELIRRLRVEVSPYPSEEKLQEDYVTRINWDVYKSALRREIHSHKSAPVT